MDICGEGAAVGRSHLLRLATEGGVPGRSASAMIDLVKERAGGFGERATAHPIRRATVQRMKSTIERCRSRVAVG